MKMEQAGLDIEYAKAIKEYNERKCAMDQNILKASELIMGHCNKTREQDQGNSRL